MAVSTLYDMLPTILEVTSSKKLEWHVDPSGGYFFQAGKNIVNVWDRSEQDEDVTGFGIRLLNEKKNVIDYIDSSYTNNKIDDYLSAIFYMARRSALDVENIIEDVYNTLSKL